MSDSIEPPQSRRDYFDCDVLIVGAGIMSATVALMLKELDPSLSVEIFERLDHPAGESTHARNNAGTGHAALCELNYTPEREDGTIDVTKAHKVMECFEVSKQFWAWVVEHGAVSHPRSFIRSIPHMSFVTGAKDVSFLKRRHEALVASHLFEDLEYSEDVEVLRKWMPLVMESREVTEPMAATRSLSGTDVNFGELTCAMLGHLARCHRVEPWFRHEVRELEQRADKRWNVVIHDASLDIERKVHAKFVFIGAGGGAIELLERSDIVEGDGYGGFPVSGQWLVCTNDDVAARHAVKVYGKAKVGTPPMSVPHLDARFIDGKHVLLFGPFAGFSTKFLKEGSYFDLARSVTPENLLPMLHAGIHNVPLTRYLLQEVSKSFEERIEALREFMPDARLEDWELSIAGQRVQIIKRDESAGGKLEFGTEIVSAKDNTLAALLGASPGASTSVSIALDLLEDCFPEQMATPAWKAKLREMIPSFGKKLGDDASLTREVRTRSHTLLGLGAR